MSSSTSKKPAQIVTYDDNLSGVPDLNSMGPRALYQHKCKCLGFYKNNIDEKHRQNSIEVLYGPHSEYQRDTHAKRLFPFVTPTAAIKKKHREQDKKGKRRTWFKDINVWIVSLRQLVDFMGGLDKALAFKVNKLSDEERTRKQEIRAANRAKKEQQAAQEQAWADQGRAEQAQQDQAHQQDLAQEQDQAQSKYPYRKTTKKAPKPIGNIFQDAMVVFNPERHTYRDFLFTYGLKKLAEQEVCRGGKNQKNATAIIEEDYKAIRRSWTTRLNKALTPGAMVENLNKLVNPKTTSESMLEIGRLLFPDAPSESKGYSLEPVGRPRLTLETLIARVHYCFGYDPIGLQQVGKVGRPKEVRYRNDKTSRFIRSFAQSALAFQPSEVIDPQVAYAQITTSPQKRAVSEDRSLKREEYQVINAVKAAGMPQLIISQFNQGGTPVPLLPEEKPQLTYLSPKLAAQMRQQEQVRSLVEQLPNLAQAKAIDCTYISCDNPKTLESELVNIDHTTERAAKAVKLGIQFDVNHGVVDNIVTLAGKTSDFTALTQLFTTLDKSKSNIIIADRGFADRKKIGLCAHTRQYFLEITKSGHNKRLDELAAQSIDIIANKTDGYNHLNPELGLAFDIQEVTLKDLDIDMVDGEMFYELSADIKSELLQNFPTQKEVVDEQAGTMYRNLNYGPVAKPADWKGVFKLYPELGDKYYLITFINPKVEAENKQALLATLDRRVKVLNAKIAELQKTRNQDALLTDEQLLDKLSAIKSLEKFVPTKKEIDNGLFLIQGGECAVNLGKYDRLYKPKGFSILTNLHFPYFDITDDEHRLLFATLCHQLYKLRWGIESYNKSMKSESGMPGAANTENARTLACKMAMQLIAGQTTQMTMRKVTNNIVNHRTAYGAYPKNGKGYVMNAHQWYELMENTCRIVLSTNLEAETKTENESTNDSVLGYLLEPKTTKQNYSAAQITGHIQTTEVVKKVCKQCTGTEFPTADHYRKLYDRFNTPLYKKLLANDTTKA